MPCSAVYDDSAGIVCVSVSGGVAHADQVGTFYKALQLCQTKGCSKILVDLSGLDTSSNAASDCLKFGKHISEIESRKYIAHVMPADPNARMAVEFTLQSVERRDNVIEKFDNAEEAKKWLLERGQSETSKACSSACGGGVLKGEHVPWGEGAMTHQVYFDASDGIVRVKVTGKPVHADHVAAFKEIMRLCRDEKCPRVLVDLTDFDIALSSTMDCYDFGNILAETKPPIRIAHIRPRDPKARVDVTFTATVADNRGGLVKEFDTVEEAKKWLLGQGQSKAI